MYTEPRCSDGDVRLVEGTSPVMGTVQICHNQDWGTVCANGWNDMDAIVVCRQLGFSDQGELSVHDAHALWISYYSISTYKLIIILSAKVVSN